MIDTGVPYQNDIPFLSEYYGTTLYQCKRHNIEAASPTSPILEIYITCFDGLLYAKYQIKTLRYFMPEANIVIIDTNGNLNPEASKATEELCIAEKVSYIKLPHNKMQDVPCYSSKLGVDMTWIFRNVVKHRQPKYFGYLDQDCFLIKPIWPYLKSYLDKKGMYGLSWQHPDRKDPDGNPYWLVHIMQNFFKYDFVKDIDLDFRPAGHWGLDTGGCNYETLFRGKNPDDYHQKWETLAEKVGEEHSDVFRDFTLHDDSRWIHIQNSTKALSGHPQERQLKEMYMTGILNGILLNELTALQVSNCCKSEMIPPDWDMAEEMGSLYRAYTCYICKKCKKVCEPIRL